MGDAEVRELETRAWDDREFRRLDAPFIDDDTAEPLSWDEVSGEPVRIRLVESDQGLHCPVPADLSPDLFDDDDDLYGTTDAFSFQDLDDRLLFTNQDFSELAVARGRPLELWMR